MKRLIFILLIICFSLFQKGFCQEQQVLINEFIFKYDKFRARIRPTVYFPYNDVYRVEAMVGYQFFKPWIIYIFWKNDTKHQHRFGIRTDLTKSIFDDKFTMSLQYRFFWGMNNITENQYYIIPAFWYSFKNIDIGAWCYANKVYGSDAVGYLGPTMNIKISNVLYLYIAYTKDIYTSYKKLLYAVLDFKFDFKKKRVIETGSRD